MKELQTETCRHAKGVHGQLEGKITVQPGLRNTTVAICIITTLFPGVIMDMVPMMPLLPFKIDPHRAWLHDFHIPDICVIGTIHKLLTREEMRADPKAIQAIKEEGKGVREQFVWDDDSVMEKSDRLALARRENKVIHVAEVMPIASIKHWESPQKRPYKGRLVFRGDNVRDSWGGAAQFGAWFSIPTNIQAISLALFYGLLSGNVLKAADCTRAFLQAMLLME